MPETTGFQSAVVESILRSCGRATLPFQEVGGKAGQATAAWYGDHVVTADAPTHGDTAEWVLRPELGDPEISDDRLVMFDFADKWTRLPRLGLAVLPVAQLHAYADGKGWTWTVDGITGGLAATAADVATVGRRSVPAYLLGHDVGENGERRQTVFIGAVAMDLQGRIRWAAELPAGCVGAPIFLGEPLDDGVKLVCLGLILPGDEYNEIVTFDRIAAGVTELTAPPRKWWQRRTT